MPLLKIVAMALCALIAYQDIRDRTVIWIAFPAMALVLGAAHVTGSTWKVSATFALVNLFLVTITLLLLYGYTRSIRKKEFLNVSFGLGDMLFLYAFALGFPTLTFVTLFSGALLFSLALYLLVKSKQRTVPLAGYMSLFLIGIFLFSFLANVPNLYLL